MRDVNRADVVIIGGGPAGMSAAVWCSELGLSAVLVERSVDIGGQLHMIFSPITNYLGIDAADGAELLERFRRSLLDCSTTLLRDREVQSIDVGARAVCLASEERISYRCLIIATGVRRRRLGVPGEEEFRGRGVLDSGVADRELARDKSVVIVGGGDAAVENALLLASVAKTVTVVHRGARLTARDEFSRGIQARTNIDIVFDTVVTRIEGEDRVSSIDLRETGSGEVRTLLTDAVLVRIGVEPNSEVVRDIVDVDERGYVMVDSAGQTTAEGIFAVGDVANPISPTLSTAVGTGSCAAKCARLKVGGFGNDVI